MNDASDQLRNVYQKALFHDSMWSVSDDDPHLRLLRGQLPHDRSIRILDAGCGNGRYMRRLAEMGYKNVWGLDLFRTDGVTLENYVAASLGQLPFADASFDFVYANSVVYYIRPPQAALAELARVLRPGGTAIVTAHNRYSLYTLSRVLRRAAGRRSAEHLKGARFCSTGQYVRWMREAGFRMNGVDGFFWYPRKIRRLKARWLGSSESKPPAPFVAKKPGTISGGLARIKSEIAYHTVLIGHRLEDQQAPPIARRAAAA
ncbi:MAG TPA: class I SAM-dependent methyltransferase [Pirellulales bacterium]|nr:class I SAM-dependent methyltransferase [Pirellulales bacterium]